MKANNLNGILANLTFLGTPVSLETTVTTEVATRLMFACDFVIGLLVDYDL